MEADKILVSIWSLHIHRKWMWVIYFWIKICLIRAQRTLINCRFTVYFFRQFFFVMNLHKYWQKKYAYLKSIQEWVISQYPDPNWWNILKMESHYCLTPQALYLPTLKVQKIILIWKCFLPLRKLVFVAHCPKENAFFKRHI